MINSNQFYGWSRGDWMIDYPQWEWPNGWLTRRVMSRRSGDEDIRGTRHDAEVEAIESLRIEALAKAHHEGWHDGKPHDDCLVCQSEIDHVNGMCKSDCEFCQADRQRGEESKGG